MSGSGMGLRLRYGRVAAFLAATSTTLVSLVGTLVADPAEDRAEQRTARPPAAMSLSAASSPALGTAASTALRASLAVGLPPGEQEPTPVAAEPSLPQDSGSGRRVVFSESEQRVWLVDAAGEAVRTYEVSGSIYDNLDPGSYEVYSRSSTATGIDGSDLRFMVRFTQGDNAAIGFHSIPLMDGKRMQTRAQLGTPLSHGCIRQALPDAKALWRFAPVGTAVVVTA